MKTTGSIDEQYEKTTPQKPGGQTMLKTIRKAVARFFKRGNVEELAEEITPVLANFEGKVRGRNLYVIERTPGTYNPHLTIRKLKSQRRNWKYWRMKK